jgi:hypothetical protein
VTNPYGYHSVSGKVTWRVTDPKWSVFIDSGALVPRSWVAGGALRGLFNETDTIADFDMFFSDLGAPVVESALCLECAGFEKKFECPEGKLTTYKKDDVKVQLITERPFLTVTSLLDTFDIDAGRIAYDGEVVTFHGRAARGSRRREVTLNDVGVVFPNSTFRRVLKYAAKGYKVPSSTISDFTSIVWGLGEDDRPIDGRFYID